MFTHHTLLLADGLLHRAFKSRFSRLLFESFQLSLQVIGRGIDNMNHAIYGRGHPDFNSLHPPLILNVCWITRGPFFPVRNVRVFVLNQELLCLGTNQLCDIRDEIRCPNDSLVVNDCSEDPDNTTPITAEEMYPSGFFCIDGVFYVDDRSPLAIDYTEPIQEWATLRRMPDLRRRSMSGVRVSELSVRLGYPYIYVHQGDCRHIMVFSDLRLFRPGVDSVQRCYPRTVAIRRRQEARECHLCDRDIPRWLTMDHELTPTNPTFFCDKCFTDFNYRGPGRTNPVCKFRAYPLAATKGTAGQPPADGGERGTGSGDDQNAGRAAPPARRRVRKVAPKSGGPGGPGDEGQGPTGSGDVQCGSSAETSAAAQDS